MKILIQTDTGRHIRLHLPTAMLCNAVTAGLLSRKSKADARKEGELSSIESEISPSLSYPQARKLMQGLRKCRHAMKGLPLLQLEETDGNKVEVYL